jgi:glycosyltransferase involved in cell wall biosynthesis
MACSIIQTVISGAISMAVSARRVHGPADGRTGAGAAPLVNAAGRPLTVLQLVPALEQGGVERGTVDVARAIHDAGGRALVASRGGRLALRLERAGGRLIQLDVGAKSPFAILSNARKLAQIIRGEGVDIVHARSRAPAWAGLRAARMTGTPFVTTYHGVHSEGFPGKRLYNSVMARGRIVIAVSHHVAGVIAARHPFAKDVRVIHRGVDMEGFSPAAVSHERIAQLVRRWGLEENPRPVIALPGRLTRWKGQETFIDAARILRSIRGSDDFLCLMIGADPDSAFGLELSAKIAASGLDQVVRLAGGCDDMAAALKLSAVGVSASTQPEAFGRVAAEVQAMERPVIATDHGGARETVAPGVTGWLVPPGDAPALAAAMQAALSLSPDQAASMGAAGRARVEAEFSLGAMLGATLQVYRDAVGG